MAKKQIGIIGAGNVGSALARGLERAGHEMWLVGNDEAAANLNIQLGYGGRWETISLPACGAADGRDS